MKKSSNLEKSRAQFILDGFFFQNLHAPAPSCICAATEPRPDISHKPSASQTALHSLEIQPIPNSPELFPQPGRR